MAAALALASRLVLPGFLPVVLPVVLPVLVPAGPALAQLSGIPACDAWMKARRACLDAGADPAARDKGIADLERQAADMRRDADNEAARKIYGETCEAMLPAARRMIAAGLCGSGPKQ